MFTLGALRQVYLVAMVNASWGILWGAFSIASILMVKRVERTRDRHLVLLAAIIFFLLCLYQVSLAGMQLLNPEFYATQF